MSANAKPTLQGSGKHPASPRFVRMPAPLSQLLFLDRGLFALRVKELIGSPTIVASFSLPAIQVAPLPNSNGTPVQIIGLSSGEGLWLGKAGGTITAKVPQGGGGILITIFGAPDQTTLSPNIEVWRLDDRVGRQDGLAF